MQRCPYLHEMKERLLSQGTADSLLLEAMDRDVLEVHDSAVGTVVKVQYLPFYTFVELVNMIVHTVVVEVY